MSHAATLHCTGSMASPQASPPCSASVITKRLRCMIPPPQSFEHAEYSLQSPMTQSIGHGCMLQDPFSTSGGQAAPPFGCTTIVRVIVCSPPAQCAEHSPGIHSDTTQSCMKGFTPFIW